MRNLKKDPTKQLEKFSTIFMQIGLVFVLFIVYLLLEYESEQVHSVIQDPDPNETIVVYIPENLQNVVFQKEVKVKPKNKVVSAKLIDLMDLTKGDDTVVETVLPDSLMNQDPVVLDIDSIQFIEASEVDEPDPVPLCTYRRCTHL